MTKFADKRKIKAEIVLSDKSVQVIHWQPGTIAKKLSRTLIQNK